MSKIERDTAVEITQEKEDVVINEELLMDTVKTFLTYDLLMCKVKEEVVEEAVEEGVEGEVEGAGEPEVIEHGKKEEGEGSSED